VLPYEREKALMLLKDMKRRAVNIADTASGDRDKLSAIALVADIEEKIFLLFSLLLSSSYLFSHSCRFV
jgi:hypothetical protein